MGLFNFVRWLFTLWSLAQWRRERCTWTHKYVTTGISVCLFTFTSTLQDSWEIGPKKGGCCSRCEREPDKAWGSPAPSQPLGGHDGAQGDQHRRPLLQCNQSLAGGNLGSFIQQIFSQQLCTKCYIFKRDQQKIMGFFFSSALCNSTLLLSHFSRVWLCATP